MTHSRNTPASRTDSSLLAADRRATTRLADDDLDESSRLAWTEAMTVRPFGDAYLVDCPEGTQYVTLDPSSCSCDDASEDAGDDRCAHVRRVAIEINLGRVPPPAEQTVECGGCDRQVAVSAADGPPYLCSECHLEPGDVVVDTDADAETPLLVVSEPGRPADLVTIPDEDRTVSEYPGNDGYASGTPVVEAVYPHAVSTDRQPRRYLFPLPRLGKPDLPERRPPELGPDSASTLES